MRFNLPFKPSVLRNYEESDLTAAFHIFMWLAVFGITIFWAAVSIIYPAQFGRWLEFFVPSVAGSMAALWLNSRGKTRSATITVLVVWWAVVTLFGGTFAYFLPANSNRFILMVVATGLILGMRAGIIAAVFCGITEITLVAFSTAGIIHSPQGHFTFFGLLYHLLLLAIAAALPYFATRSIKNALNRAKRELEERRRAEHALRQSEESYLNLIGRSPNPIIIHAGGNFVYLNSAAAGFLHANSPDELVGKPIMEIVHPDSYSLVVSSLDRLQDPRATDQLLEERLIRLDGSVADVEAVSIPTTFLGKPAVQTIIRDVTDRKRVQAQMRLQNTALNSAANGILITEPDGTIVWANPAFEQLSGYVMPEAVGENFLTLGKCDCEKTHFYGELWNTVKSGEVWAGEFVSRRKDGTAHTEYMTITPVKDDGGAITHLVAVKEDITSRKLLEEQLLQSQKLEGIGQLAGGVAHDYNNILNVIIGYSELLNRKVGADNPSRQSIEAILSAARRGAGLTRQLLAFARKEIVSPKVININSSISSIRRMLHRVIGENLRLIFLPGKDLWNIKMDPTQFDQILVNLATNARDAIKDVGTIKIITCNVPAEEVPVQSHPDLGRNEYVKMTFSDNGRGMTDEVLQRVFEPFFTTKPEGAGTGLGLSTVYGIVKQNGGVIKVSSNTEKGTEFEIYLRRFDGKAEGAEEEQSYELLKGTETILVVEDQPDLLNLVKISLEDYGYNVMTALDPEEALLLCEAYSGRIQILLTDLVMPKMNGVELSERISGIRSGIKSVFMSGYGSTTVTPAGFLHEGIEYLQKPFSSLELASKVREVMEPAE